ncbi:MAG: hypothetical protein H0T92_07045 [Pyrinomonadaceae bacterium]|nr:hypothetical protein [Pyrinomonadaceae bacterium]
MQEIKSRARDVSSNNFRRPPWLQSKSASLLLVSLAISPACLLAILIYKYSVDVPYWDQWALAPIFEKVARGSLGFNDLFAQQNEYRQFFPNVIFISLGWLTAWNVKYEMLVIFLLACFVSLNLYRLNRLTVHGSSTQRLPALLVVNLFIFSPIQYDNWLFGVQIVYFMPVACITTGILVAYSKLNISTKFLICMSLSTISTFSSANGILCWIVALPVLAWSKPHQDLLGKNLLWKKWLILLWVIGFALNLAAYLYDYQKPALHPSLSNSLLRPSQASLYFLAFLGAGFAVGRHPLTVAVITGTTSMLLFILSCGYLLRFRTDFALVRRMIGWVMIGAYSVLTGMMVTYGRLGFGVEQSLSSRYTTFSIYLIVSLVPLTLIIFDHAAKTSGFQRYKRLTAQLISLACIALIGLHLLIDVLAIGQMKLMRHERLQAKACVTFINIAQGECLTKKAYPNLSELKRGATILDNLGFLRPGLVKSNRVEEIQGKGEESLNAYGSFNSLMKGDGGVYTASGWAILPRREEPADSVVLTYEKADGDSIMFMVVSPVLERKSITKAVRKDVSTDARWQTSFSQNELPSDAVNLAAWAFDALTGKAFRLSGTHSL